MLTRQDILDNIDFNELEDKSLRYKNTNMYITVGNNTYSLYLSSSDTKYRQELPDTIQQLVKQINRYRDYTTNPNSLLKEPKHEYNSNHHKMRTAKVYKNLYSR